MRKIIDLSDERSVEEKLDSFLGAPSTPFAVGPAVPNLFPRYSNYPYRIAIIGEAPGTDEVRESTPFVGMSGRLLDELMLKAKIVRDGVFIGNICQHRPPYFAGKQLSPYDWHAGRTYLDAGLAQLQSDLAIFQPNIVLLLGASALFAAKGVEGIDNWRGSFFIGSQPGPFFNRKCIASHHPAKCLREYSYTPVLMMDIHRTKAEGESPVLVLPERTLIFKPTFNECSDFLTSIITNKTPVSLDIEGYWNNITCVSFATSPAYSFIVPFVRMTGESYWTETEEVEIWALVSQLLYDPLIPKTWQNGLYDRFCFQYGNAIPVFGNAHDTMLKFWEKYCELEKSLGFQCSLLTKEPYYKAERKADDTETHYRYCCKDSAVTFEINDKLGKMLLPDQLAHYAFNHTLLNPLLYMELRGILYDIPLAKKRLEETNNIIYGLQASLDTLAGRGIRTTNGTADKTAILTIVKDHMCYKRDQDRPKAGFVTDYQWAKSILLRPGELSVAEIARLSVSLDLSLNIKGKQLKQYLYEELKLPPQYKVNKITGAKALTTDYEALLKIQRKDRHPAVELAIQIGLCRTRSQMLEIGHDPDGRIRCGYNVVGSETGRLTCYTSPTGSGYNLQTIPAEDVTKPEDHPLRRGMRDLFIADPGYYLFQCDLSGADGWTVGAYLAALGDSTMLDDLKAKLKPAAVICFMLRHGNDSLRGKTRDEIKELLKEVKKEDWDYFACKQGIWGTCYTMGPDKLASIIAINSEGKIWLSRSQVNDFQAAVFARYRVRTWHNWMGTYLRKNNNTLIATNGFRRKFYGRSSEVLGQALAHLPQVYTTYATNKAMFRLWNDKENRLNHTNAGMLGLRIEPLHQVHDALIGQFRIEDTAWATTKIKSYFDNPITIASTTLTIPFEGTYGTNWSFEGPACVGKI